MSIQGSINNLLSQAQRLATFYSGFNVADKIVKDQKITKNEAQIQTDIAAGNAPMKDGKVDPDWIQKRREELESEFAHDKEWGQTDYDDFWEWLAYEKFPEQDYSFLSNDEEGED